MAADVKLLAEVVGKASQNALVVFMHKLAINLDSRAFHIDPQNQLSFNHPNKIEAKIYMGLATAIRDTIVELQSDA